MSIFDLFKKIGNNDENSKIEKIVVGLGNPSPKYEDTRHNAGFCALDFLSKEYNININKKKFDALVGDGKIINTRCLLVKPLTFMNCSGQAVEAARKFYKLNVEDIVVLVDDISFEPGTIKIKRSGSSGGHNGIKSIIYDTGESSFCRVKIGVGKKPEKIDDLAKWVLSNFNAIEQTKMKQAYEKVSSAIGLIVNGKIDEAMNKFN